MDLRVITTYKLSINVDLELISPPLSPLFLLVYKIKLLDRIYYYLYF